MGAKKIVCTVTNDLNYDQRMIRICNSLSEAGYEVLLVGRRKRSSINLKQQNFQQKRLFCFFEKGKLFYMEYNMRLFFYLLFLKMDAICAIDLDTILPCLWTSMLLKKPRVYDAHELFCEMDEIVSRPLIYRAWKQIERYAVPKFENGYTVCMAIADEFKRMYGVNYAIVRSATVLQPLLASNPTHQYILYQGAVNEGRCFETLLPAMQHVKAPLIVCGEGNFFEQAKALTKQYGLEGKIQFKGYVEPELLREYTKNAYLGITLFSTLGRSNYYSLANRFFDYMHSAVPQLCMAYPEYIRIQNEFEIAKLIENTDANTIATAINELLENTQLHQRLKENCLKAREVYCWQEQEKVLLSIYKKILG